MVQPNSRMVLDIVKDENSHITTSFHYENLKTSFYGFYSRNKDYLFVIFFLLFVIGLHLFRHTIMDGYRYLRNKRFRLRNDIPNLIKCKKCKICDEDIDESYRQQMMNPRNQYPQPMQYSQQNPWNSAPQRPGSSSNRSSIHPNTPLFNRTRSQIRMSDQPMYQSRNTMGGAEEWNPEIMSNTQPQYA
ncbi:uncharacterized protein LOC103516882 isoform X1 [Diaphorina citri]|uniref:Uncharacterized protein LOC103516882 isoform X1 n=1 Tax=Diaphorina citri TaxID=121845 RepID=A0A1S3DEM1_DIACI|nr:uncharacterized protein LOC103516882 isoform X3 [Diaphorina citri]XP_008480092.1 uncharacterized protein LOC103516882 isoform X4 [Diaphorina citri]XP_026684959.1 uncharacterized protein LOC103516882 isoform X1 [Diaphorina citri]KAI5700820.1 hypothetical protein M8J75_003133 [Diaphorina citri]KAI5730063.1 hypothetical protein M8J76_009572 [Diaphorina citri]KAI5730493.1 hypothetical protein M8J76_014346 [Diaphorina citri]KAI5736060.1 hypothetical protein M8J77_026092 [Diaphorina citri]